MDYDARVFLKRAVNLHFSRLGRLQGDFKSHQVRSNGLLVLRVRRENLGAKSRVSTETGPDSSISGCERDTAVYLMSVRTVRYRSDAAEKKPLAGHLPLYSHRSGNCCRVRQLSAAV